MNRSAFFFCLIALSWFQQGCESFSPKEMMLASKLFWVSSGGRPQLCRAFSPTLCLHLAKKSSESSSNSAGNKKPKKKTHIPGTFRADRVLANRGWGSRSECFELLKQRRVFQKIGNDDDDDDTDKMRRILGPKEKISMEASLWVDRQIEVPKPPPLLRLYHKPKWMLSVMNDSKHGRKNLGDLDFISNKNMHPVGRLDYDTSGLILFSSDGTLTQTLLHPSHEIQKEYVAVCVGKVDNEEELRTKLAQGVTTSMGAFPADVLEATPIPEEQVKPLIDNILDNLPPEYNVDRLEEKGYLFFKDAKELTKVRLVVEEGKHRMVRRILANSGLPVISLKRERLGIILLDDLEEGSYRDLTEKEEQWAKELLTKNKQKPKKQTSETE